MVAYFFIALGMLFVFFGVLGLFILPDIFLRFHSATKTGVTGLINIVIGLAIYSGKPDFWSKLMLIFLFVLITSPIIAQILALSYLESLKDEGGKND